MRSLRPRRNEQGATLILAIVFMVVIGAITSAVLSAAFSGITTRTALDKARDREYAADAGIEYAIASVRSNLTNGGPGFAPCGPYTDPVRFPGIQVKCDNAVTFTLTGFEQRNVVFSACNGACLPNGSNVIIRAQVNFQAQSSGANLQVTRTWVQSWSVNG